MTPPAPHTILLVDDESSILAIAQAALSAAGYQTTRAETAEEARRAVRSAPRPFDLIVLDLTLPGESGADLIPEFRKSTPGSRILIASGLHADDVAGLNADGFLSKPFTRGPLVAAVNRVLGR